MKKICITLAFASLVFFSSCSIERNKADEVTTNYFHASSVTTDRNTAASSAGDSTGKESNGGCDGNSCKAPGNSPEPVSNELTKKGQVLEIKNVR